VTEVLPRDGLQSLDRFVPTDDKARIVEALVQAGFTSIEVTAFARPDVVPNLADAEDLVRLLKQAPGVEYRALAPNRQGALRAVDAGIDAMVALVTATESYGRRNQNRGFDERLDGARSVLEIGRAAGIPVEIAIAMAFFDPYEGDTPPSRVETIVQHLLEAGAERFYLATSTGLETPLEVLRLLERLHGRWPSADIGLHLHDTNGMALATALLGLDAGVVRFESSLCGIGGGIALPTGMPPAGNVATEDLVHLFSSLEVDTGLDLARVTDCARQVARILDIEPRSSAAAGATKADALALGRQAGAGRPQPPPLPASG
jgi:hydroxymethylglutaryl-CoA lyase